MLRASSVSAVGVDDHRHVGRQHVAQQRERGVVGADARADDPGLHPQLGTARSPTARRPPGYRARIASGAAPA